MYLIDLGRGPVKFSFQGGHVRLDQILIFPNLKVILKFFSFFSLILALFAHFD